MYEAIVFLPLLGAILAGFIALAGARARHPGANPPRGAENSADDHGPHIAPVHGHESAVVHPSHDEPQEQEPPAAGSRAAEAINTARLFFSAGLYWIAF